MKRRTTHILLAALAALALWPQRVSPADAEPREPYWHPGLKIALPFAEKSGKPVLTFIHAFWDANSWEAEQEVLLSKRFAEMAGNFVLCRAHVSSDDLKDAKISAADLGGIVFFDKDKNELERIRWRGRPDEMLDAIARVAAGKSVASLEAKIKADPKDIASLEMLYEIYSKRWAPQPAAETLKKILEADPRLAKKYEGHVAFWELISSIATKKPPDAAAEIEKKTAGVKDAAQRDALTVLLAGYRLASGKTAAAREALEKFVSENHSAESVEEAYSLLLKALVFENERARAFLTATEMLKKFPRNRECLIVLRATASELYAAKNYPEAAAVFKTMAQASPRTIAGVEAEYLYGALTNGIRLRERAAERRTALDALYIVPDVPTFLAYLSRWDDKQFFPILIDGGGKDDRRLIAKFVAAFKPSKIIDVTKSVGQKLDEEFVRRAILASFDERIWSDVKEAKPESFKQYFEAAKIPPMGIVFVDTNSPAMLAGGAALAAGHRQLIDFYSSGHEAAENATLDTARKIRSEIIEKIAAWGYSYLAPFDDIDFVTVACPVPVRFKNRDFVHYATDDFIIRRDDDVRFAFAGRLAEGITSANYMAMCALFLQPREALFFDGYGTRKQFAAYDTAAAATALGKILKTANLDGEAATLEAWKKLENGENSFGYVHVNSMGDADYWMAGASRATVEDIPAESVPAIIHMTHSYSAQRPFDAATIAGRWLKAGAYIYYGSTEEPFLESFRTPSEIVETILEGDPLGMAYRRTVARPYWRAWRLCYFGDPLYVVSGKEAARAAADKLALAGGEAEIKDIKELPEKRSP